METLTGIIKMSEELDKLSELRTELKKEIDAIVDAIICMELDLAYLRRSTKVNDAVKWSKENPVNRKPLSLGEISNIQHQLLEESGGEEVNLIKFTRTIERAHGVESGEVHD